ncbi:uncharacterized protein LOC34621619 [Cyclospora cayetanensis]|uniref:Uncharacterized protein LOC34621619 n=1 Tax=Cyclospora cayetanensis TaxID=88456 RepID=A0A6P6RUW4_9EIME|nr:uncharacterized protein LOC34621619 [Cyclospora cayetanensis]
MEEHRLKTASSVLEEKTAVAVEPQSPCPAQPRTTALRARQKFLLALLGRLVGLVSKDQCTPCPAGKFCSIASLATPSGNCEPGFICYGMAETPTPTDGKTGENISAHL